MTAKIATTAALLKLRDVSVVRSVGEQMVRILDHLSLDIPQGQHTVILGPNGSGKTSLLKLLNRQFYPSVDEGQTGEVEILGRSCWNVEELRRRMGIVTGDLDREFALPRSGRMTALQAVLSGFDGVQLISFTDQNDVNRIDDARAALRQVGLEHLIERTLMTMSTGERRRVLIARALVPRPEALILDEPTTGLDIAARSAFLTTIRRLAQSGITIILVTHHVEEIIPEIRTAVLLKSGRVFAQGSCDQWIGDDSMSELFEVNVRVTQAPSGRFAMDVVPQSDELR
ncbi:MAG TPA: ABC transporter ATP-binding protein [Planctomycetaceae bacterium]|nr:ABC transporter ATP-binding protein [Planctomycetaceae bacterium]